MLALYMRLSAADGDLDGAKAESNSIVNQRRILHDFVKGAPDLAAQEVEEFIDDGFSGSNFERPEVQRMLEACRSGRVDTVIVKDLSRFAREFIDAGTYIEQIFPFLRVRFISVGEGYDSLHADMDRAAPDLAIRNIANAAYCRDTSIRIQSTLHTKYRRGLRPRAVPPFGYMVNPNGEEGLAPDERFAPTVRRIFELAATGAGSEEVARKLNEEGFDKPGVAYRKAGLYGFDKRPDPVTIKWDAVGVQKILKDPVYKGTLVTFKTHRKVMSKKGHRKVDESERYVTEDAHEAIVAAGAWEAAQGTVRRKEKLEGMPRSQPVSPFARGFVRVAECGHALKFRRRFTRPNVFETHCDCTAGDPRAVDDIEVADAIAVALRDAGTTTDGRKKPKRQADVPSAGHSASERLEAYELYVEGKATLEELSALSTAPAAGGLGLASHAMPADIACERAELLSALEEHRLDDIDRKLLRRLVKAVLVHPGNEMEVVLDDAQFC
jgi:site-specific DNA recombinase